MQSYLIATFSTPRPSTILSRRMSARPGLRVLSSPSPANICGSVIIGIMLYICQPTVCLSGPAVIDHRDVFIENKIGLLTSYSNRRSGPTIYLTDLDTLNLYAFNTGAKSLAKCGFDGRENSSIPAGSKFYPNVGEHGSSMTGGNYAFICATDTQQYIVALRREPLNRFALIGTYGKTAINDDSLFDTYLQSRFVDDGRIFSVYWDDLGKRQLRVIDVGNGTDTLVDEDLRSPFDVDDDQKSVYYIKDDELIEYSLRTDSARVLHQIPLIKPGFASLCLLSNDERGAGRSLIIIDDSTPMGEKEILIYSLEEDSLRKLDEQWFHFLGKIGNDFAVFLDEAIEDGKTRSRWVVVNGEGRVVATPEGKKGKRLIAIDYDDEEKMFSFYWLPWPDGGITIPDDLFAND